MELTAVLTHAEEGGFVALNPETGTTTQGASVEEAIANLRGLGWEGDLDKMRQGRNFDQIK